MYSLKTKEAPGSVMINPVLQEIKSLKKSLILNGIKGAGEMAQLLRVPTGLPKVQSSNPSNYMVAHNHL